LLGGFLSRAREIEAVLKRPDVAFVLVMTPDRPAVNEALFFARRLREGGSPLSCFIANRTLFEPTPRTATELHAELASTPALCDVPDDELGRTSLRLNYLAGYLARIASAQKHELERLSRESPGIDITTVPLLPHDVSSIDSLRAIADRLGNS